MKIDEETELYGVVGYPIRHSLSPTMHNAAFSATNINAVYLAFEVQDMAGCLKGMKALNMKGLSVTMPHKTTVIPLLDEVDDLAAKIGAVNTIVNRNGRLIGYNTDATGALKALEEKVDLKGKTGIIIGAGGAARAIGYILKDKGLDITVVNRSIERGRALAQALSCPFIPIAALEEISADILINTTPVGMMPHTEACIVTEQTLKKGMVIMDIIYHPLATRLITMAGAQGCLTVNGLTMFLYQGAEQFRIWTGREAPMDIMADAVKQVLKQ